MVLTSRRIAALVGVLVTVGIVLPFGIIYVLATTGCRPDPSGVPLAEDAAAVTTTLTPTPIGPDDGDVDRSTMSIRNVVVLEHVNGMTVDEATTWARERGWTDVRLIDLGTAPSNEASFLDLNNDHMTIYHCDGVASSAVVG